MKKKWGDFYKNMFAKCPTGRPGTADEVSNVAELLMSDKGAFITGTDFMCDGVLLPVIIMVHWDLNFLIILLPTTFL